MAHLRLDNVTKTFGAHAAVRDLVLEVADGEHAELEALVRKEMGSAYELAVPLEVSVGYGKSWNEAAH